MKNTFLAAFAFLLITPIFAQESLIADIMNVDAVSINDSEKYEEALNDYQEAYDDEIAKLDEVLAKLGEDYQKEVTGLVEDFSKTLEEAVEKDVKNSKQATVTQVTTLTMSLKSDKKKAIQDFKNVMDLEIRKLPKTFAKDKEMEVSKAIDERKATIEAEYKANTQVVAGFKNTEHLVKTSEPTSSGSDN